MASPKIAGDARPRTQEHRPPVRQGKKAIAGYFDQEVSLQLKQLGLEQNGRTVQDLLAEALNLLFAKHKKPPIA